MSTPRPGDIFLTQIGGVLGLAIRLGQVLAGDPSRYTHAGIVLDDGTVIAALPRGARIDPLGRITSRSPVAFSDNELTDADRAALVRVARSLEGTPYSFLDYVAIVALAFGFRPRRLRAFIAASGHMICSQLVDTVYAAAGLSLFDDGRAPGDVTPGDLAHVGRVVHQGTGPFRAAPVAVGARGWLGADPWVDGAAV